MHDESNLGLGKMLGIQPPAQTLMDTPSGARKLSWQTTHGMRLKSKGTEEVKMFSGDFGFKELSADSVFWDRSVGLVQVGKIEHSHEGCACPMGALAREFLNKLQEDEGEWVIVDTEAGVEHLAGVYLREWMPC
jgi:CO dehydrogenase maturation factor